MPNLPPDVEQVVWRALAKDPHQRFPTVQDFAIALEQASQTQPMSPPQPIPMSVPIASTPPMVLAAAAAAPTVANPPPPMVQAAAAPTVANSPMAPALAGAGAGMLVMQPHPPVAAVGVGLPIAQANPQLQPAKVRPPVLGWFLRLGVLLMILLIGAAIGAAMGSVVGLLTTLAGISWKNGLVIKSPFLGLLLVLSITVFVAPVFGTIEEITGDDEKAVIISILATICLLAGVTINGFMG